MPVFCNPVNINYRYQFIRDPERGTVSVNREAADPSLIFFGGRWYIFASMTLGVWASDDLVHWENHRLPDSLPHYDYAPDVRVIGEWVVICASKRQEICNYFRTKDILNGPYEVVRGSFPFWDPNLFQDDDGKVYFYWGCSDKTPIYGVEVDPDTLQPICGKQELISGSPSAIGYERIPEDPGRPPYIEGAWMNKHGGRYYLQYACPGTEFNTYCDAVYVSNSPLGPFRLAENNPYSYHPGGFMPGAGHGSTVCDAESRLWHVSSMRISVHHIFERRVGLWRAGYDEDGELFCSQRFGDWPMRTETEDPWADPEWFLLSYRKPVTASSFTEGHAPDLAADENAQTWWQAAGTGPEEWLCLDLEKIQDVRVIQVNFADDVTDVPAPGEYRSGEWDRYIDDAPMHTRWRLEGSADGENYFVIEDKSAAETDLSHDLIVREEGLSLRYLRLGRMEVPYGVKPCISGLRVFGYGEGTVPGEVSFTAKRTGELDAEIRMHADGAVGYTVLWGPDREKLYHCDMSFEENVKIGAFVSGRHYAVRVDAFNESGITKGSYILDI